MVKWLTLASLSAITVTAAFPAERAAPAKTIQDDIITIMRKAADWQLAHPVHKDTQWQNGALYAGLLETYRVTGDSRYLETLMAVGKRNRWSPGSRLRHADDQCIGQTYLELYLINKKNPEMISAIRKTFDTIMATPKKDREDWWWCDALFMAPPALARLATATGEQKYLDFMNTMWWDTTGHLYDPEDHLFFRDKRFFTKREKNGQKVFWSRGNGWVLAGLGRVLQYLPKDYPARERYVSLFQQMSAKIAALQQDDGFWRTSLLDPDSYPGGESSGTGFLTYALAWGVNHKLLSREKYLPVIQKGWNALVSAVEDSGKLGWVQPVGDQPQSVKREDSETYGTGAFLLAGSEMGRIFSIEPLNRE